MRALQQRGQVSACRRGTWCLRLTMMSVAARGTRLAGNFFSFFCIFPHPTCPFTHVPLQQLPMYLLLFPTHWLRGVSTHCLHDLTLHSPFKASSPWLPYHHSAGSLLPMGSLLSKPVVTSLPRDPMSQQHVTCNTAEGHETPSAPGPGISTPARCPLFLSTPV